MSHPLVQQMLASARASGASRWLRANCLACPERKGKTDTKNSWAFNSSNGFYRCLRCGLKGRVSGFASWVDERVLSESERLAEEGATECFELPTGFRLLDEEPARSSLLAEAPRRFLDARGIGEEKRRAAGIGACFEQGCAFFGRVILPLRGQDGSLVGYVGRDWNKKSEAPYKYPKGLRKGEILHGADKAYVRTDEPLVMVEGYLDALYLSGGGDAVPCLGMPSEHQMDLLLEAERPVVFVLDGDAWVKGFQAAERLRAASLAQGGRGLFGALRLPGGTDPDEYPPAEIFQAARGAVAELT